MAAIHPHLQARLAAIPCSNGRFDAGMDIVSPAAELFQKIEAKFIRRVGSGTH
jgi:hypothetical protein